MLTNLKLDGLHESVIQMIHATEQQEVMITHLAPFRDGFFEGVCVQGVCVSGPFISPLKLDGLHESVMQMTHATEKQEVIITHLAPFRDGFFEGMCLARFRTSSTVREICPVYTSCRLRALARAAGGE
jgi:hypothetical protein